MSDLQANLEQILQEKTEKIIPENIKKGVQIFDIVGTLEQGTSGVKLFETQEEMQADTTAKEGDLAVVYRSEIQNMTADTQTQHITFPETVTLQEAFSGNASIELRAVDSSAMFNGNVTLDQNSFRFDGFTNTGMIMISYTSTDGINYTREEFMGNGELTNPVDLGTIIKVGNSEAWNDVLGHFMQVGGNTFEGLFEYIINGMKNKLQTILIDNISFNISNETVSWNGNYGGPIFNYDNIALLKQKIDDERPKSITTDDINRHYYFAVGEDDAPYIFAIINKDITSHNTGNAGVFPFYDTEGNILGTACSSMSVDSYRLWAYKLNLNDNTYEEPVIYEPQGDSSKCYWNFKIKTVSFQPNYEYNGHHDWYLININVVYMDTGTYSVDYYTSFTGNLYPNGYTYPSTQLTATASNIYNAVAYGKDGVAEGTLTQSPSNSFTDINAEVYYKIQKAYDSMEPIVLTDEDKEIDKNIYFIPTNSKGQALLDTSNLTNINNLFSFCRKLSFIPLLDISNAISAYQAFSYCSGLTSIPLFNTGKITNMQNMFYGCTNLTSIPQLNTSKSTNMQEIFAHCTSLVEVPVLDTGKVTSMMDMFFNCTSLSDDSLNNILQMCVNASSYTKTKTLKYIGLTQEQATKCTTLSNYEAFTAAGWTTGY